MNRCGLKRKNKRINKNKCMCFEEIGLRAQKLLNVIGSIVNINEGIPI